MRITKYVHSCLLIEEAGKTILIDPGIFTYEEHALAITTIQKLDYLLITHEHPDHMHMPFIKELISRFPSVMIITNPAIVSLLQKENIHAETVGDELIHITEAPHERVFDKETPQNVLFTIAERITIPGDSLSFPQTKEILALPLMGPSWMITQAVEKALALKPSYIIPIHDWHWKDEARKVFYQRLDAFFTKQNILFKSIETGEQVEIA